MAQTVKNLPTVKETQVRSLSREDPLEKGMATHSSILAWRIPGTEEPGGLQSIELMLCRKHEVISWVRKIPWKREWLPTPVFLPEEFHGHRSLAGYSPWGSKESDMTEQLSICTI